MNCVILVLLFLCMGQKCNRKEGCIEPRRNDSCCKNDCRRETEHPTCPSEASCTPATPCSSMAEPEFVSFPNMNCGCNKN